MAASQFNEMQPFISKYCYLSGQCLDANLNFNSFNGHIYASQNVELGKMPSPNHIPAFHEKPSKLRRRRRRKNWRNLNEFSSKTDIVVSDDAASAVPENDIVEAMLVQVDEGPCDSNFEVETRTEYPDNAVPCSYSQCRFFRRINRFCIEA